jgi:Deacetylase PdaC/Protein of unknown function (DUF3298)
MKRIVTYVLTSLLTFTCGITAGALFPWHPQQKIICSLTDPAPPATPPPADKGIRAPDADVVFGGGRLKLVPEEVQLKSRSLQYDLSVRYPQITGTDAPHIQRLNQRIKELATKQYQWMLYPSKENLRYYREKHPEAFNELSIDYEVTLATDSILSIYFVGYSYGIGAGTSVQYSFTINYDLVSGKELKLSDLFTPGSGSLGFISRYCTDQLARHKDGDFMHKESLAPETANYESWNVTRNGIRFNFDECEVFGCAAGEQAVEIPFTNLKFFLSGRALSILGNSFVVEL